MKIWGFALVLSALVLSCKPDEPVVVEESPVFPQLVENNNVLPGETLTLSFVPNLDWTLRIPEESIKWFSIQDGTFETDYISGKASETAVNVTLKVADIEEFDASRTCEVSLTMGKETKVIARYTRQAKDRTIAVYAVQVNEDGFVFGGEDGGYLYHDQEATSIDLLWPEGTNGFRTSVKVEANFPWTLSLPEWAEAEIPENTTGQHSFDILGVPSKYPLDGDSGKILFKAGDNVVKELDITIPACIGMLDFGLEGAVTALSFNGNGDYAVAIGYEAAPAYGTVFGPQGVSIVAVEKTEAGYASTECGWVHIKIADWDKSGNVLQNRTVEYSVDVNEGEDREAVVFVLPATFKGTVADLFSGTEIKEEYSANWFPITQGKASNEFLTPISDQSVREEVGMYFSKIAGGAVLNWFGQTDFGYKLTYSVAWSLDEGWMYLKEAFHSYKIFDKERNEQKSSDFWLSLEATENKRSVRVVMNTDVYSEGFIAFYDAAGNNLGVIRCYFDPSQAPVGGADVNIEFIGESADYAGMIGASLTEVTSGPLYDSWIEYNAPIYHLKYKVDNFPMRITLPKGTIYYMTNPYSKRNLFRVNDLNYDEYMGSFSYLDGGVDINMSLDPEQPDSLVNEGVIIFSKEKFNTTDKVTLILVCTLDMSGE